MLGRGVLLHGAQQLGGTPGWSAALSDPNVTISNGNLQATGVSAAHAKTAVSGNSPTTALGRWVFAMTSSPGNNGHVGVVTNMAGYNVSSTTLGGDKNGVGLDPFGSVTLNNSTIATVSTFTTSDVIHVATDLTAKRIWFKVNSGNWNNSGTADPAAGAGGIDISGGTFGVARYAAWFDTIVTSGMLWTKPTSVPTGYDIWT